MITRRKFTLILQFLAFILLLGSAVPAAADGAVAENKVPANVEGTAYWKVNSPYL